MKRVLWFIVDKGFSITDDSLNLVKEQVGSNSADHLFLTIQSYGGDPFATVGIMRFLHERFKKISAVIPHHAMSAGTLMALGTDEIFMTPEAMLGPLDLPIEHPSDGSRISAGDLHKSVTEVAALSDAIAKNRFRVLREEFRLGKAEAAHVAFETATAFVQPIIQNIDPYHLQKSYREIRIGMKYAFDLLSSRMMSNNEQQAVKTAIDLVDGFPAHEFGIFASDARERLRLTVKSTNELGDWSWIENQFAKLCQMSEHAILYTEEEK